MDLKIGDIVKLKPGGPRMIVTSIQHAGTSEYYDRAADKMLTSWTGAVFCRWFTREGLLMGAAFHANSLRRCGGKQEKS